MKWANTRTEFRSRHTCVAMCARVFCVVVIYLAHTIWSNGAAARDLASADSFGLETSPVSQENGSLGCCEGGLDSDAIRPDSRENDPFCAFLALTVMPLPVFFAGPDARWVAHPCPADACRSAAAPHPHLRLLENASQVLC